MANRHFDRALPATLLRIPVGPALEAVLEEGDLVRVSRGLSADLALSVRTRGNVKCGMGAVGNDHLRPEIGVEDDPRAEETSLLDVIWSLDRPDTTFIWMNVSDPGIEAVFRQIQNAPASRLVIAIAGEDPALRRQMNRRVGDANLSLRTRPSSCRYVDVDARFKTQDEWLRYVRSLATSRPDDLWLRISIGAASVTLREGSYDFVDPWHLFVRKVYEPGLPGEPSQLGIARSHPALMQTALVESTNIFGSGRIEIVD